MPFMVMAFSGSAQHMIELFYAPGTIHAAKTSALQFYAQFLVSGQRIFGVAYFIMEEANGCQICLNGGSRFPVFL